MSARVWGCASAIPACHVPTGKRSIDPPLTLPAVSRFIPEKPSVPLPLKVLIIGAGLAGLACALKLQNAGISFLILEASNAAGGRVRTDELGGFLLDRGFQVYLDAYPEAGQILDLPALDLHAFSPGALVFYRGKMHRVMDVFRCPGSLIPSALAPIGTIADKLRVALLKWRTSRSSLAEIATRPDFATAEYLRKFGFSEVMIDVFFRSFYGGIFLERELRTSSRMFEFTFKMFSAGSATLPAGGMGEITRQLGNRLPTGSLRLNSPVASISPGSATLASGEIITAAQIVVATDATTAAKLLPEIFPHPVEWRAVTNLYYTSSKSPIDEPIIALNGSGEGIVNNVCVLSEVSRAYAPPGQHLISVSVLGLNDRPDLPAAVKSELAAWFGPEVSDWQHLRSDRIEHALPEQLPGSGGRTWADLPTGLHLCGDYQTSASIEGAITSGHKTAESLIRQFSKTI